MEKYKIVVSRTAEKALRSFPKKDIQRVIAATQALAVDPYPQGCRKLQGEEGVFRVRVGVYRIIYEVRNRELLILVLKIGNRKDVYR